ncbi:unnamed protein product, partial [Bubo scandiacus]
MLSFLARAAARPLRLLGRSPFCSLAAPVRRAVPLWCEVAAPPRPAGRPAAAWAAAAAGPGGAEDEDLAEEALQGLLHRPAARPALRLLQDQPPAQAAEAV